MQRGFLVPLLVANVLGLPLAVFAIANLMWPNSDWVGPTGTYFGINFVNFWTAGHLANDGQLAAGYNHEFFIYLVRQWFAPAHEFTNLSYPPTLVPFLQPLGLLPYFAALSVWMTASVVALFWAILGRLPRPHDGMLVVAIGLSPILINNLAFASIGLFIACAFVTALRVLPVRPILAGVLIGLLTVKPQIGVLLPLVLIVLGQWRAFGAATVTALSLVALSLVLYGPEPWRIYLSETTALQWSFLYDMGGFFASHMTTIYAAFWALGASTSVAFGAHIAVALVVAGLTLASLRTDAAWPLKATIVAFGSVMIMPYVLGSDLAIPLAALVWYLSTHEVRPNAFASVTVGWLWLMPFPLTFLLQANGVPATQPALLLIYGWLVAKAFGFDHAVARWWAHKTPIHQAG